MKLINVILILCFGGFALSCQKSESGKSNEAKLLKVTCSFGTGTIDNASNKVIIKAPESTDISQIIPQFETSKNATIYPPSGVATDFTNPVTYTITSEDKATIYVFTVTVLKPIVKFTVYDCSNWSPTNFNVLLTGATIKLFTNSSDVGTTTTYDVLITDANAQATLYGLRTNNYYLTVGKDNKSNIKNGYVLAGTYNTQAEVDASIDPNAKVGGLRYLDVNGDARLDASDKVNYQVIRGQYDLSGNTILLKNLYISQ